MMVHLNRMRATSEAGEDGKHFYKGSMPQNCCEETNAHKSFHSHLSSSKQASRNESESEDCDGVIRVPSGSGFRMMKPFPWLLHEMLEDIEKKRLSWVVSWSPDGRAFQVHSPERFSDTILPTYFRHKRYKSFQRQLYLYGFRSLQDDSVAKGKYFHPLFLRENRTLCRQIVRPKSVSTSSSRPNSRPPRTSKKALRTEAKDVSNEPNTKTTHRLQDTFTGAGPSASFDLKQPCMLNGSFEPLPYNRGVTTLPSQPVISKSPPDTYQEMQPQVPRMTGVVSTSVIQVSGEAVPRAMQQASHALLKNMQLAMLGMTSTSQSNVPDSSQDDVMYRQTREGVGRLECNQFAPEGPIYSMSLGNSNLMNFEACSYNQAGPLADPVSSWNYGTASIQELEPYSDSIITLFGSGSEF